MNAAAELTFSQWLDTLNDLVHTQTGMTLYELPSLPYAEAYHRSLTPDEVLDTLVADVLERDHRAAA